MMNSKRYYYFCYQLKKKHIFKTCLSTKGYCRQADSSCICRHKASVKLQTYQDGSLKTRRTQIEFFKKELLEIRFSICLLTLTMFCYKQIYTVESLVCTNRNNLYVNNVCQTQFYSDLEDVLFICRPIYNVSLYL